MASQENSDHWQRIFEDWPAEIERRGAVITKIGEVFPFSDFLLSPSLLLLERDRPDVSGARKAIVAYDSIAMIKFSAATDLSQYESMGFQSNLSAGVASR